MNIRHTKTRAGLAAVSAGLMLAVLPFGPALAGGAKADAGAVNTGYFGSVAIEGYDTVAYFTDGKATKGSEDYSYDWLGASWHFANDEHRKLFAAESNLLCSAIRRTLRRRRRCQGDNGQYRAGSLGRSSTASFTSPPEASSPPT